MPKNKFTSVLEKILGLNFSCVSFCLDKPISVSATVLAFLENHRVITIIPPAINNKSGSAGTFLSKTSIEHRNWNTKELHTLNNYLPEQAPVKILITSGASCPDAVVEAVIQKIAGFYNVQDQVDFANVVKNQ